MRSLSLLGLSAGLWLASLSAGEAQGVSTGLEVWVNPGPGRSSGVLLYPGGEYSRIVPQLLHAGQRDGPVSLHPPGTRRIVRSTPRPVRMASAEPPPPRVQAAPPRPRVQAPPSGTNPIFAND